MPRNSHAAWIVGPDRERALIDDDPNAGIWPRSRSGAGDATAGGSRSTWMAVASSASMASTSACEMARNRWRSRFRIPGLRARS